MRFFVPVPQGLEELLQVELADLGGRELRLTQGGVGGVGELDTLYRLCLWSRLGSRVLLELATWQVAGYDDLYHAARGFDWPEHLAGGRFALTVASRRSVLEHSGFAILRVKDALVDSLRSRNGSRPDVDTENPDVRFHLFLAQNEVRLYLDFSGPGLHRRGTRTGAGQAPLKENLAAALLIRAGWPELAGSGAVLLDPMCGSGTFLLEGAMIAGRIAPGLRRERFGFEAWPGHRPDLWRQLRDEAAAIADGQRPLVPRILGFDADGEMVAVARRNLAAAGLDDRVAVRTRRIEDLSATELPGGPGLLVVNPPYGERLGDRLALRRLYAGIGELFATLSGWRAGLLTGDSDLARATGWAAKRSSRVKNGPLDCRFYLFDLCPEHRRQRAESPWQERARRDGAMFRNRLRKNLRRLQRWADKEHVACYRIYDRDIPEFALAIDRYGERLHVQEFRPPSHIDERLARARLEVAIDILLEECGLPADRLYCKERRRQKGREQYRPLARRGELFEVEEDGLRLLVNLQDYLDTGLFLDHRPARRLIRELAAGRHFLNLFCYTASATVHAAAGGAKTTTSVDLSRTYLDWAERNLRLNGFHGRRHRLVRAHCLEWLRRERAEYDLIFCDPPTFSNSKSFAGTFDVQRDQVKLLELAMRRLAPGGLLIFSTNRRGFRLDPAVERRWSVEDWTEPSLPPDFGRRPPIHRCWLIRRAEA